MAEERRGLAPSGQGLLQLLPGLVVVLAVSATMIFHELGTASLFGDESIYAETSRESVERGTWLPLYKATGQLFPNKPPAKILLVTACFKYLGESEFSARLPDAVFGVLTAAGVFVFAARRFGVSAGMLAAAVLLGSQGYLCEHGVRESVMDSMLTLLAFGLCAAWINFRNGGRYRTQWWIGAACAVLLADVTKNMLGVIFAVVVVAAELAGWVISRRRSTSLRPALGLLAVSVVGGAAYFLAMMAVTGGDFASYLYSDIIERASTGVDPVHLEGTLFYLRSLGQQFNWWLVFLLPAVWWGGVRVRRSGDAGTVGFMLLWIVIVVGGFSLSVSKLPWYIYPVYPQLSVVIAFGARETVRLFPRRSLRLAVISALACAAACDLRSSWQAVQRDVVVIDEQRFLRAYSALDDSALVIDANSLRRHGRLRSWSRYYLEGAPNSRWFDRGPIVYPDDGEACLFLATGEPWSYPPTAARTWRTIGRFKQLDALGADIWIVGTCDLDLPWIAESGRSFSEGLITADGFEGGDFRGWTVGDDSANRSTAAGAH